MAGFDDYITEVHRYIGRLEAEGRLPCRSGADENAEAPCLCVGPGANRRIILRSDTYAELGSPEEGSCGLVLWTDSPQRLANGQITRIGPDVGTTEGVSLPFGQVVMVGGVELTAEDHTAVVQSQYVADQIEGFMVRSTSANLWCRISKEAVAKGFCLEILGRALMQIFLAHVPRIEAIEIVFVTSSKDDVHALAGIADGAKQVSKRIVEDYWKSKGYDLDCDFDCGSCSDEDVCDGIRDIISARAKKMSATDGDTEP